MSATITPIPTAEAIIEQFKYGILVMSPLGHRGLPCDALTRIHRACPADALMWPGIAHHYTQWHSKPVVFAAATKEEGEAWEKAITATIANLDPESRWWFGVDVGASSAALFAILSGNALLRDAAHKVGVGSGGDYVEGLMRVGATPRDAYDFGRCKRLVDSVFPDFRRKLYGAYPATKWAEILERWDEIAAAEPARQSAILEEIHYPAKP